MMCCFGRDRQFGDGNGQCRRWNCEDKDPADNTNLCFTKSPEIEFVDESEGDTHCHGFAWGEDESDEQYMGRFNTLFYVAMYDHLYSRGYVESVAPGVVPMCGCLEKMSPVSRADCTELELANQEVLVRMGNSGVLEAEVVSLDIDFRRCRGIDLRGRRKNNDLSARVNRLVEEGLVSDMTRQDMFVNVLVGSNNPNDNENEEACQKAWERYQNN